MYLRTAALVAACRCVDCCYVVLTATHLGVSKPLLFSAEQATVTRTGRVCLMCDTVGNNQAVVIVVTQLMT
jgi:hypothetical protein